MRVIIKDIRATSLFNSVGISDGCTSGIMKQITKRYHTLLSSSLTPS